MSKAAKKTTARRTVAKSSNKAKAAATRLMITDEFTIKVLNKNVGFENKETGLYKNAMAVLASKTVAEAKKKGADSWTVRDLVNKKVIAVSKPKAA